MAKRLVAFTGLALIVAVAAAALWLPSYVQQRLLPDLVRRIGADPQTIVVRRIGWSGADLGPLTIRFADAPPLTLDNARIDYRLTDLWHGRLSAIRLFGLSVDVTIEPEQMRVNGYAIPIGPSTTATAPPDPSRKWPVAIDNISIRRSTIRLFWQGHRLPIALDMDTDTSRLSHGRIKARMAISLRGQQIDLNAGLTQNFRHLQWHLSAQNVLVGAFADFLPALPANAALIHASIMANGQQDLGSAAGGQIDADVQLTNVRLPFGPMALSHQQMKNGKVSDIALHLSGNPSQWRFQLTGAQLEGPVMCRFDTVEGRVASGADQLAIRSRMHTAFSPATGRDRTTASRNIFSLGQPFGLDLELAVDRSSGGPWHWRIKTTRRPSKTSHRLSARLGTERVSAEPPQMDLQGRIDGGRMTLDATLSTGSLAVGSTFHRLELSRLVLTSRLSIDKNKKQNQLRGTAALQAKRLGMAADRIKATANRAEISGDFTMDDPSRPTWHGKLLVADAQIVERDHHLTIQDASLDLPLAWPAPVSGPAGRLNIARVSLGSSMLGTVKGTVRQTGIGLALQVRHDSRIVPGLVLTASASVQPDHVRTNWQLPGFSPRNAIALGRWLPAAKGIELSGSIQADGSLVWDNGRLTAGTNVHLENGRLTHPAHQLDLAQIRMDLALADLVGLRSGPGQSVHIGAVRFGTLRATDVNVDFQIEPGPVLFVEQAGVNWCQGRLNTHAIRVKPGIDDYQLIIYADRLSLADVLDQFGVARASGEGAVNGRIPLHWKSGQITFDNGFLYSTPGRNGTIHLEGTEPLLAGLAPGSPQHTQLDIASEALKDYSYKWARLTLQSRNDILAVKLEMDGRPNRLLPFGYDSASGQLKRIPGKGQATFEGIGIDLNFNSPLNKILQYKDLLKGRQSSHKKE